MPTELFFEPGEYEEVTDYLHERYSAAQRRTFLAPPTETEFGSRSEHHILNLIGPFVGHPLQDDNPGAL